MIKKTMYFYDKKQADLINKVNDKLHRARGVKVGDANEISDVFINDLLKTAIKIEPVVKELITNIKNLKKVDIEKSANALSRIHSNTYVIQEFAKWLSDRVINAR